MKSVYLCSPTNSTIFTRCCEVAILDHQALCPVCQKEVYPGKNATENERRLARWESAYGPRRRATLGKDAT